MTKYLRRKCEKRCHCPAAPEWKQVWREAHPMTNTWTPLKRPASRTKRSNEPTRRFHERAKEKHPVSAHVPCGTDNGLSGFGCTTEERAGEGFHSGWPIEH